MKSNSNLKTNSKLIFLSGLLLVITFAFIFASGCIVDDNSNYTPSSNMAEVIAQQLANAKNQGQNIEVVPVPVPGGIVQSVNDYVT